MRRGMTQTTRRARGAVAVGVAVVAAGLAGGCTGDDPVPGPTPSVTAEPAETPSATPTPTPTAAPETVKPEVPAAMSEPGTEGAAAAAQYFLSLYPYVYATGDLAEWQAMSHQECVFCASVVTNVQAQVAAGQHSEGGMLTLSVEEVLQISTDLYSVSIDAEQESSRSFEATGELVDEADGSRYETVVFLIPGPAWTIRGIEVTATTDGS